MPDIVHPPAINGEDLEQPVCGGDRGNGLGGRHRCAYAQARSAEKAAGYRTVDDRARPELHRCLGRDAIAAVGQDVELDQMLLQTRQAPRNGRNVVLSAVLPGSFVFTKKGLVPVFMSGFVQPS